VNEAPTVRGKLAGHQMSTGCGHLQVTADTRPVGVVRASARRLTTWREAGEVFVSCTSVALRGHRRSPWSSLTSRWLHARRTTGTVFPMCSRTVRARLQAAAESSLPNSRCYASRRRPSWRQGRRSPTCHATLGRAMAPGLLDSSAQRVVELPPDLPRGDCRVGTMLVESGSERGSAWGRGSGGWGSPRLVWWLAFRPVLGPRFSRRRGRGVRPRR
jgi:hypothetical protein